MPNNMQPHLSVFIALYSEAEIVCTLWVACFCQCSLNKRHYRKKKTHKRLHDPTTRVSGFMWDGWQRQVTFLQLTIFLPTLLLFSPSTLSQPDSESNQSLSSHKLQSPNCKNQTTKSNSRGWNPLFWKLYICETLNHKIIFNKYVQYNRMRSSNDSVACGLDT